MLTIGCAYLKSLRCIASYTGSLRAVFRQILEPLPLVIIETMHISVHLIITLNEMNMCMTAREKRIEQEEEKKGTHGARKATR